MSGIGIVQLVGIDEKRVALFHPDIPVGLECPGVIVEMGAVAIHEHVAFAEFHIAYHNLIVLSLFGTHLVGTLQKHLVALVAACPWDSRADR